MIFLFHLFFFGDVEGGKHIANPEIHYTLGYAAVCDVL